MGKIQLESMEFYAFHGCYNEEQVVGNRFLVDVTIETNLSKPAKTDDLKDAVDYQKIHRLIKQEMKNNSKLLENIGNRILDAIFAEFPELELVTLKVSKMNPPMEGKMRCVSITMERQR